MLTVLITGATSGIGLYIADRLTDEGYKVYGTSRSPGKQGDTLRFQLLELDITSEESIRKCKEAYFAMEETLDILINNAGIGINGSAEEVTLEQAYRQFETNFWGAVKVTRAVLPAMRKQRAGKIITIGSLAGFVGVPCQSYYSASKHALEGFFKSLRLEVHRFNIGISIVEPGFFKTNLHNAFEYAEPSIPDYDSLRKETLHVISGSIKRTSTPEPVAHTVLKIIKTKNPKFSYPVGKHSKTGPSLQFLFFRLYEFLMRRKFRI
jgi:NAD(P)-dependent dehydrogenase (short-subunit alcohol dehydrogenase family)